MGYLHIIIIGISTVLVVVVAAAAVAFVVAVVIVLDVPWSSRPQVSHEIGPECERVFPNRTNLPNHQSPDHSVMRQHAGLLKEQFWPL